MTETKSTRSKSNLPVVTSYAPVRGEDGLWRLAILKTQGPKVQEVNLIPAAGDFRYRIVDLMIAKVTEDEA